MGKARARLALSGAWPACSDFVAKPISRAGAVGSGIRNRILFRNSTRSRGDAEINAERRRIHRRGAEAPRKETRSKPESAEEAESAEKRSQMAGKFCQLRQE